MKKIRIGAYYLKPSITEILEDVRYEAGRNILKDISAESGNDMKITCPNPNHAGGMEANPDCHINLSSDNDVPYGFCHCFACGFKGNFARLVATCLNTTEDIASNWLLTRYGDDTPSLFEDDEDIVIAERSRNVGIDAAELNSFSSWTPYLAKRKLSREVCEKFGVKYDAKLRDVVFPVRDVNGALTLLARRSVDTKTFKLPPEVEKPLYGLYEVLKSGLKTAVIVEGPIDMLTCWDNGVPAIATLGALSSYQINILNNCGLSSLYVCFDNDDAGRKFKKKLEDELSWRILTSDVDLPNGRKDVNELTKEEWFELKSKFNLPTIFTKNNV